MYCRRCGAPVADGSRFCPSCGAQVDAAPYDADRPAAGSAPTSPAGEAEGSPVMPGSPHPQVPVETNRSFVTYLLLGFVTFGIYSLYFRWKLLTDTERMVGKDETTSGVAYVLLSFVTLGFYDMYCMYKNADNLQRAAPRYGLSFTEGGGTILLWYLVGFLLCGLGPFVAVYIIIKNCNSLAVVYNASLGRC